MPTTMLTERLEIRQTEELDRDRFVALFASEEFMVFAGGVLDRTAGNERFDAMLSLNTELPFAKQPLIEQSSGVIIGYCGVDQFDFEGETRLEFGYRLVPSARGMGYATEAGSAVLALATETFTGELLALIDPLNQASHNVIAKLGFTYWKEAEVGGFLDAIYRRTF